MGTAGSRVGVHDDTGPFVPPPASTTTAGGAGGTAPTPPVVIPPPPVGPVLENVWLAFDSNQMGKRQVFATNTLGAPWKPLTDGIHNDFEPAFSPDGRTLAFTSDRGGTHQIYAMELTTGGISRLTNEGSGASQPVWSRDGKSVAFRGGPLYPYNPSVRWDSSRDSSISVLELATGRITRVPDSLDGMTFEHPGASGRSNTIVADRYNLIAEIDFDVRFIRNIVVPSTTRIETPSVSSDGTLVAFGMMCELGLESIWLTRFDETTTVCTDGRAVRYTPKGAPFARRPAFGPTGLIAFEQGTDQADIAIVASPASVVAAGGPSDERNPAWSPVGTVLP